MPTVQRYCMRCARPAVRIDSATEEIWNCPTQHGVVYRAPLETPPPETAAATEPEPETETEPAPESHERDEEEADKPEQRARAPARVHAFRKTPPAKKHIAPKKK